MEYPRQTLLTQGFLHFSREFNPHHLPAILRSTLILLNYYQIPLIIIIGVVLLIDFRVDINFILRVNFRFVQTFFWFYF